MTPLSNDEITAYHEAGHAVAAMALDRPVHKVSIKPKDAFLGICEFRKGVFRPKDDWLEREVLIALAGIAAEARRTGAYDRIGARRDLKVVHKLGLERVGERSLPRFEARMFAKAENLLADEGNWKAVELIAAELLKLTEISGRAARHLFEMGCREEE